MRVMDTRDDRERMRAARVPVRLSRRRSSSNQSSRNDVRAGKVFSRVAVEGDSIDQS